VPKPKWRAKTPNHRVKISDDKEYSRPIEMLHIKDFEKEFWDVFCKGVKSPVHGYNLVMDTGDHQPIAVKKPHYGLHKITIMEKMIDWLLNLHQKRRSLTLGILNTLTTKPHQEHVEDIKDYIWQFCVNYILLYKITRPAQYLIPHCHDAVMYGFGTATNFILLDQGIQFEGRVGMHLFPDPRVYMGAK
jgi:hypothetical protein